MPPNGQIHSNNLSAAAGELFECVWPFCAVGAERVKPFMHNVKKWPNIFLKSCGVYSASFLKYVWPFFGISHESHNNF